MTPDQKKEVATRALVENAIALAFTLAALVLMKKLHQPDFGREFKMKLYRGVKTVAQKQADNWQNVADIAATSYNKVRM